MLENYVKRQLLDCLCANSSHDLPSFNENFIFTVKSAQISMDLEKVFVCVFPKILGTCTCERNQNKLSILSGLMQNVFHFSFQVSSLFKGQSLQHFIATIHDLTRASSSPEKYVLTLRKSEKKNPFVKIRTMPLPL